MTGVVAWVSTTNGGHAIGRLGEAGIRALQDVLARCHQRAGYERPPMAGGSRRPPSETDDVRA